MRIPEKGVKIGSNCANQVSSESTLNRARMARRSLAVAASVGTKFGLTGPLCSSKRMSSAVGPVAPAVAAMFTQRACQRALSGGGANKVYEVVVFGGNGFVGTQICKALVGMGVKVVS